MSKESQVARAKRDLAEQLQIFESNIDVKSVEDATWPDTSLGVPKPGLHYAEMLLFGCVITLEANGTTYIYHCDDTTRVVRAR
jgi:hypothetical protein